MIDQEIKDYIDKKFNELISKASAFQHLDLDNIKFKQED